MIWEACCSSSEEISTMSITFYCEIAAFLFFYFVAGFEGIFLYCTTFYYPEFSFIYLFGFF